MVLLHPPWPLPAGPGTLALCSNAASPRSRPRRNKSGNARQLPRRASNRATDRNCCPAPQRNNTASAARRPRPEAHKQPRSKRLLTTRLAPRALHARVTAMIPAQSASALLRQRVWPRRTTAGRCNAGAPERLPYTFRGNSIQTLQEVCRMGRLGVSTRRGIFRQASPHRPHDARNSR